MSVRIVDVREITKPISSPIRNAYIDFTKMTTSLVAVVTDVVRDGKTVVGYGFNSNGRYGQGGLIRERFAPRLMEADPKTLLDDSRRQSRSRQGLGDADVERKAGRSRRALGRGRHHRHGGVGRGGQDRGQAAIPDARRASRPHRQSARVRLCRRRLLLSRQGSVGAARRDAQLSRSRLQRREDEDRRRADRGRPRAHRSRAEGDRQPARNSRSTPTAASIWRRRSPTPRCCATIRCSGTRRPAIPSTSSFRQRWRNSIRGRWRPARICSAIRTRATSSAMAGCGRTATGCNSIARCPTGYANISARLACCRPTGWSPSRCIPHGGHQMSLNIAAGLGLGGNESYPDLFQPYGGFPDGVACRERPHHDAGFAGHRL